MLEKSLVHSEVKGQNPMERGDDGRASRRTGERAGWGLRSAGS